MANIKHFDHRHSTVAEVRACPGRSTGSQTHADPAPPVRCENIGVPEYVSNPATGRQVAYLKRLIEERDVTNIEDFGVTETILDVGSDKLISFREARAALDALEAAPAKTVASRQAAGEKGPGGYPVFEDGYYAIRDEEDTVHFYRLSHDEGNRNPKYEGWPVVQAQASDDLHLVRNRQSKIDIINAINEDPHEAQLLYASELGNCYVCGRTLTDETSRRLGIGPVCRGKRGMAA